jgi:hypothetical protein
MFQWWFQENLELTIRSCKTSLITWTWTCCHSKTSQHWSKPMWLGLGFSFLRKPPVLVLIFLKIWRDFWFYFKDYFFFEKTFSLVSFSVFRISRLLILGFKNKNLRWVWFQIEYGFIHLHIAQNIFFFFSLASYHQ